MNFDPTEWDTLSSSPTINRRKSILKNLLAFYDNRCFYCKNQVVVDQDRSNHATVDHVVPKSAGGTWARYNLVLACYRCNSLKADMEFDNFMAYYVPYLTNETLSVKKLISRRKQLNRYNKAKKRKLHNNKGFITLIKTLVKSTLKPDVKNAI